MRSIAASNRSGAIALPSINSRLIFAAHPDPEIKLINLAISRGADFWCVGEGIGILGKAIRRSTSSEMGLLQDCTIAQFCNDEPLLGNINTVVSW